ncbi:MAG: AAA family ATPase [Acidimicrobiales bacterium]
MRVHHVRVCNFRGIKTLDWHPRHGLNCLIGPGDSCKTTVLDAISVTLAHRWNLTFSDADFYSGDPGNAIQIDITLTGLDPASLAKETFGECLRGLGPDGTLHDEPVAGTNPAITIRLTVDASLEPAWWLVRGPTYEPRRISALQRQHLLVHRIDETATEHLTWSRSSALARGTAPSPELPGLLASSQRAARKAIFDHPSDALQQAAAAASVAASTTAATVIGDPRPGLDPAVQLRSGSLVLHDGELPIATRGLGSRRLTSLAVQRWATSGTGVLLLDEVEAGLEPHRVRHLIRGLRTAQGEAMQVFCTTHSPTVIEEAAVAELCVVRTVDGSCAITSISEGELPPDDAGQALARSSPSAFLSRRIAVMEGKTEVGIARALMEHFDLDAPASSAAVRGVVTVDGAGATVAPVRAVGLAHLGYDVALIVDNDGNTSEAELNGATDAGCTVIQVGQGHDIEAEVAASLPIPGLQEVVDLAVALSDSDDPPESIRAMVQARLPDDTIELAGLDITGWITVAGEPAVRLAVGRAASAKKWFKTISKGEQLGKILVSRMDEMAGTPLGQWIDALRAFTHPIAP